MRIESIGKLSRKIIKRVAAACFCFILATVVFSGCTDKQTEGDADVIRIYQVSDSSIYDVSSALSDLLEEKGSGKNNDSLDDAQKGVGRVSVGPAGTLLVPPLLVCTRASKAS